MYKVNALFLTSSLCSLKSLDGLKKRSLSVGEKPLEASAGLLGMEADCAGQVRGERLGKRKGGGERVSEGERQSSSS